MDEHAVPAGRVDPGALDVDRMEVLEQQVRQLTSRLASWVEAQLVQAHEDRRDDFNALRADLQSLVTEQSARLDSVAERSAEAAASVTALKAATSAEEGLEPRIRDAMSRLSESVESQLAELARARDAEAEALRTELLSAMEERVSHAGSQSATTLAVVQDRLTGVSTTLGDRVDDIAQQLSTARERLDAFAANAEGGTAHLEAFEQRVKSAMGRLTDSVESRLKEATAGRQSDLDGLRSELTERLEALAAEVAGRQSAIDGLRTELTERLDGVAADAGRLSEVESAVATATQHAEAFEQRVKSAIGRLTESVERRFIEADEWRQGADARVAELVEAKLSDVVERRRAELDEIRREMQEGLSTQIGEARAEIGTTVADAHRRFLVAVEDLDERVTASAAQSSAVAATVELVNETVVSDGRRIEALELHTRRTDARLTDLVEVKLSELAGERSAELDEFRAQLRTALDVHLADTRRELEAGTADARKELAEGAAVLQERQAALDQQVEDAVATLDAVGTSVDASLKEAEERLGQVVQARLVEFDTVAGRVDEAREELRASQEEVRKELAAFAAQLEGLASATTKALSKETGMLAPLRSDVRMLQAQVAELTETVSNIRPRRKTPAAPLVAPVRRAAPATKAVKAVKAEKAATAVKAVKAVKTAKAKKAAPAKATKAAKAVPAKTAKAVKTAKAGKATAGRRRPAQ